jgi:hypothetical protein
MQQENQGKAVHGKQRKLLAADCQWWEKTTPPMIQKLTLAPTEGECSEDDDLPEWISNMPEESLMRKMINELGEYGGLHNPDAEEWLPPHLHMFYYDLGAFLLLGGGKRREDDYTPKQDPSGNPDLSFYFRNFLKGELGPVYIEGKAVPGKFPPDQHQRDDSDTLLIDIHPIKFDGRSSNELEYFMIIDNMFGPNFNERMRPLCDRTYFQRDGQGRFTKYTGREQDVFLRGADDNIHVITEATEYEYIYLQIANCLCELLHRCLSEGVGRKYKFYTMAPNAAIMVLALVNKAGFAQHSDPDHLNSNPSNLEGIKAENNLLSWQSQRLRLDGAPIDNMVDVQSILPSKECFATLTTSVFDLKQDAEMGKIPQLHFVDTSTPDGRDGPRSQNFTQPTRGGHVMLQGANNKREHKSEFPEDLAVGVRTMVSYRVCPDMAKPHHMLLVRNRIQNIMHKSLTDYIDAQDKGVVVSGVQSYLTDEACGVVLDKAELQEHRWESWAAKHKPGTTSKSSSQGASGQGGSPNKGYCPATKQRCLIPMRQKSPSVQGNQMFDVWFNGRHPTPGHRVGCAWDYMDVLTGAASVCICDWNKVILSVRGEKETTVLNGPLKYQEVKVEDGKVYPSAPIREKLHIEAKEGRAATEVWSSRGKPKERHLHQKGFVPKLWYRNCYRASLPSQAFVQWLGSGKHPKDFALPLRQMPERFHSAGSGGAVVPAGATATNIKKMDQRGNPFCLIGGRYDDNDGNSKFQDSCLVLTKYVVYNTNRGLPGPDPQQISFDMKQLCEQYEDNIPDILEMSPDLKTEMLSFSMWEDLHEKFQFVRLDVYAAWLHAKIVQTNIGREMLQCKMIPETVKVGSYAFAGKPFWEGEFEHLASDDGYLHLTLDTKQRINLGIMVDDVYKARGPKTDPREKVHLFSLVCEFFKNGGWRLMLEQTGTEQKKTEDWLEEQETPVNLAKPVNIPIDDVCTTMAAVNLAGALRFMQYGCMKKTKKDETMTCPLWWGDLAGVFRSFPNADIIGKKPMECIERACAKLPFGLQLRSAPMCTPTYDQGTIFVMSSMTALTAMSLGVSPFAASSLLEPNHWTQSIGGVGYLSRLTVRLATDENGNEKEMLALPGLAEDIGGSDKWQKLFKDHFYGAAIFRIFNEPALWLDFRKWREEEGYANRRETFPDGCNYLLTLDDSLISQFLQYLQLVAKKDRHTGNPKSVAHLMNRQYFESIPSVFKTYAVWPTFLRGFAKKLRDKEFCMQDLSHEPLVKLYNGWKHETAESQAKTSSGRPKFVGGKPISDLMEIWDIAAPEENIPLGYGGTMGADNLDVCQGKANNVLAAAETADDPPPSEEEMSVTSDMGEAGEGAGSNVTTEAGSSTETDPPGANCGSKQSPPRKRKKTKKTAEEKRLEVLMKTYKFFYTDGPSDAVLLMLGMVRCKQEIRLDDKRYQQYIVLLNGKPFALDGVEHKCCKMYILVMMAAPANNSDHPNLQKRHTWPFPEEFQWHPNPPLMKRLTGIMNCIIDTGGSEEYKVPEKWPPAWCCHPREKDLGPEAGEEYRAEHYSQKKADERPGQRALPTRTTRRSGGV